MLIDAVEALSPKQRFGSQNVSFGSVEPLAPSEGDLWYEIPINNLAPYSQPWIWNATNSLWLSQPFFIDFGSATVSATGTFEKPVPFYGATTPKFYVRQVGGIVRAGATTHGSANYFSFSLRYTTGTSNPLPETTAYDLATDTGFNSTALGASNSRRILEYPNVFIPGNAWSLRLAYTRVGSVTLGLASFYCWAQFGRV